VTASFRWHAIFAYCKGFSGAVKLPGIANPANKNGRDAGNVAIANPHGRGGIGGPHEQGEGESAWGGEQPPYNGRFPRAPETGQGRRTIDETNWQVSFPGRPPGRKANAEKRVRD
jgi:hypothetical protein